MRSARAGWGALAISAIVLALVPGCREDEQNRPLHLEKGVYQGKADRPLTDEERRELRHRGLRQQF
ncbi:MAG: hypothetical protein CMN86_16630 [Stappia sp.]|nr:hypothetical protein [Stappia sp.]